MFARSLLRLALFVLATVVLAGCPGAVNPDGGSCPPGTSRPCTCATGASGTQPCAADGAAGTCDCASILDAGTDTGGIDAAPPDSSARGEFGAPCTQDDQCASNICLVVGHCSRTCMARTDCPASTNWQCLSLPGRGQICACAGIAGMTERACNGVDDNCDGVIDEGSMMCGAMCVDSQRDPQNCGSCGIVCGGGQVCNAGACGCPANRSTVCGTQCVDLQTDVAHCGRCNQPCPAGMTGTPACTLGTCSLMCPLGSGNCDRDPANGCETDTRSSTTHCGACDRPCLFANATGTCATGSCVIGACTAGFANCDTDGSNGCEVDTRTSLLHCGGCGQACARPNAVTSCVSATCGLLACNAGFGNCDGNAANGCEVEFATNATNCGSCGRSCSATSGPNTVPACMSGTCSATCISGYADCDAVPATGCEIDTRSDVLNCGACGMTCPSGDTCVAGRCMAGPCPSGQTLCAGGVCRDLRTDVANCGACGVGCAVGESCVARACGCFAPRTMCGGACVELAIDLGNCGACGRACMVGEMCRSGTCVAPPCPAGESFCSGTCTDIRSDAGNCGACGRSCGGTMPYCSNGTCVGSCPSHLTACGAACVDTRTDARHCGDCGRACYPQYVCTTTAPTTRSPTGGPWLAAGCAPQCTPALLLCNRACVNTQLDTLNCGGCGVACAAGQNCVGGACTSSCPAGETLCGAQCTDVRSDAGNCGACGRSCGGAAPYCSNGMCLASCPSHLTACGAACVDTRNDARHCGECGRACYPQYMCTTTATTSPSPTGGPWLSAGCAPMCSPGLIACNRSCVNVRVDPLNCGGCGVACAAGQNCVRGTCAASCPAGETLCGAQCTDVRSDAGNCGACGRSCGGATPYCSNGTCLGSCPPHLTACAAACVDTRTDARHCGECGRACYPQYLCTTTAPVSPSPTGGPWLSAGCAPACSAGLLECGRSCVNPTVDSLNCGACGVACSAGQNCVRGACTASCPAGETLCGAQCTDVRSDAGNCGACGRSCGGATPYCSNGACVASCPSHLTACAAACVDTRTDARHCGECGRGCYPQYVCTTTATTSPSPTGGPWLSAGCAPACGPSLSLCNRSCVNTEVDSLHCGACGVACAAGQNCVRGACTASCTAGETLCGAQCTDVRSDAGNCGLCGRSCGGATPYCSNGMCLGSCPSHLTACGAACVDTRSDARHCGDCGRGCYPQYVCTTTATTSPSPTGGPWLSAGCGPVCGAGLTLCNRSCVNRQRDPLHCGSCGSACAFGQICDAGACR